MSESVPLRGAVMRQTLAILHDAYREMNSKKMFWICLLLSGFAMACFAVVAVTPTGLTFAGRDFASPYVPATSQYKFLFSYIIIEYWLTWGMLILAIISTAGIFPDFLSGGSVELFISKPISRLRLFFTKYLCGMLFVLLQVTIFAIVAFIVVGVRGTMWEPRLFLAIPIVLCMFSYLYAVSILFGVLSRSTVASLLLTILIWALIGGAHFGEVRLQAMKNLKERRVALLDRQLKAVPTQPTTTSTQRSGSMVDAFRRALGTGRAPAPTPQQRERLQATRNEAATDLKFWTFWHKVALPLHWISPKTSDTSDLLLHQMLTTDEFMQLTQGQPEEMAEQFGNQGIDPDLWRMNNEIEVVRRGRTVGSIVGTSLIFEAVVVGIAAWIFCRRDF